MGNERSKRSSSKAEGTDVTNGQHTGTSKGENCHESGVTESSNMSESTEETQQTLEHTGSESEIVNDQTVTDTVAKVSDNAEEVINLQDNTVNANELRESSTDEQVDRHNKDTESQKDNRTDPEQTTPRKDIPSISKDDSGVESSSDIVLVSRTADEPTKSASKTKVAKKAKKSDNKRANDKYDQSTKNEIISLKPDKRKKLKKKVSKQNSTISDVGVTSSVSVSSDIDVSGVSSDPGRGTLERSASSVEPGFVVITSKENKKPRQHLNMSFSNVEQQKEKKRKQKVDKRKSYVAVLNTTHVVNTNKEKRRSIFEEDFTVELGLAEENLDIVSLSSLSSATADENGHSKPHMIPSELKKRSCSSHDANRRKDDSLKTTCANNNNSTKPSQAEYHGKSGSNIKPGEQTPIELYSEIDITKSNLCESSQENECKGDALKKISIDYNSHDEDEDDTEESPDYSLGNYSLVDQIIDEVSREYGIQPNETLADNDRNGVRRLGHSSSLSPARGAKQSRPFRRMYSEDTTRSRLTSPLGRMHTESQKPPRQVILTRPLSFEHPKPKGPKGRQNSFSDMLKKSATALTHHRVKSDTKSDTFKEMNAETTERRTSAIVYM